MQKYHILEIRRQVINNKLLGIRHRNLAKTKATHQNDKSLKIS